MKNKQKELNNREISIIIPISEKSMDFNIKQNKDNQAIRKELFQINKAKILTLEKDKSHKISKFIKKVNKRQNIDKFGENKYFNVKNFFHIFSFILLNMLFPLSVSYKTRKLDYTSIVNMFIKKSGTLMILSKKFQTSPDQILINSEAVVFRM